MAYAFPNNIQKKLAVFEDYLKSKKYGVDTIRQTKNYAGIYLEWLEREGKEVEDIDYRQFMDFIFSMEKEYSLNQTRRIILAARHYYDSLQDTNNPATGIYLKGKKKSLLNDIVPYASLLELYEQYPRLDDRDKRNKVILGLLIYQAVTTKELHLLETVHIKLQEGKIYIPGSRVSNHRLLEIHASQLLELQEYLLVIRPRMIEKIDRTIDRQLFFSERGSLNIKDSLYHMFRAIKRTHPSITSGKIIRATVIAEWLKTIDIRLVQYMAGHKYVSSTERYNAYNLQGLKDSLKKYHPLG